MSFLYMDSSFLTIQFCTFLLSVDFQPASHLSSTAHPESGRGLLLRSPYTVPSDSVVEVLRQCGRKDRGSVFRTMNNNYLAFLLPMLLTPLIVNSSEKREREREFFELEVMDINECGV